MGVTVHLGALELSAKAIIERFGKENCQPGDVLIHNNPFPGGTHLPDVDVITPVFHEGELVGLSPSPAAITATSGACTRAASPATP